MRSPPRPVLPSSSAPSSYAPVEIYWYAAPHTSERTIYNKRAVQNLSPKSRLQRSLTACVPHSLEQIAESLTGDDLTHDRFVHKPSLTPRPNPGPYAPCFRGAQSIEYARPIPQQVWGPTLDSTRGGSILSSCCPAGLSWSPCRRQASPRTGTYPDETAINVSCMCEVSPMSVVCSTSRHNYSSCCVFWVSCATACMLATPRRGVVVLLGLSATAA